MPGNRCVIIPHSMVKRKRGRFNSFSGKMHRSAQNSAHTSHPVYRCLHVLALFPTSPVSIETYLPCWYAIVKLQVKGVLTAFHLIAQEKCHFISHS